MKSTIIQKWQSLLSYIKSKFVKKEVRVICDTNVWYRIAHGEFIPPREVILIPTSFTLYEIVSSEKIASNPVLIRRVVEAIHTYGKEIIPVNPYDFVIMNNGSDYQGSDKLTKNILSEFSKLLTMEMDTSFSLSSDLEEKIRAESKKSRQANETFANYCNQILPDLRKKIKSTTGVKAHLAEDGSSRILEMTLNFFSHYISEMNISFEPKAINPETIKLFSVVTENYFKHLETTKNMKVDANDAVDWLNILYVQPGYKYLTFENSWKRYISQDPRTKDYLFVV